MHRNVNVYSINTWVSSQGAEVDITTGRITATEAMAVSY